MTRRLSASSSRDGVSFCKVLSPAADEDLNEHRRVHEDHAFYRVLEDSHLYTVDFGSTGTATTTSDNPTSPNGSTGLARIEELSRNDPGKAPQRKDETNAQSFNLKKMAEEVVESDACFQCEYPYNGHIVSAWFVSLSHVDNAYLLASVHPPSSPSTYFLERLPSDAQPYDESGKFHFRILVPIELRKQPDLLSPVISRYVFKNAEEIVECNRLYRCPDSGVTFCKLAYEDGWLFDCLNSGIRVLEKLKSQPHIEHGQFFYIVRIPVGVRVAPHIMAQRAGKGFKLHSIVEASQRLTPPGSKITYVRVCKEKDANCGCAHGMNGKHVASCHGGWVFETTMDGQVVLEPIARPQERLVERLFYQVLEDVVVLPTPALPSSLESKRKRYKDTLIECSERFVPSDTSLPTIPTEFLPPPAPATELSFVKLRHDAGWVCEQQLSPPYSRVLEQVQGFAMTKDDAKFYRVLMPTYPRSAPDFECSRLPGITPFAAGSIVESSLQYKPPGSRITYLKVSHNGGWIFDMTPTGEQVVDLVDDHSERVSGTFYYRILCESKDVLLSPESRSQVLRQLPEGAILKADVQYTAPRSKETFIRLVSSDKGWIQLDGPEAPKKRGYEDEGPSLMRISERLFNLYANPPDWVSLGYPNRTWVKVPDDGGPELLLDETLLQMQVFQDRHVLGTSSQGKDSVPMSRRGRLSLDDGKEVWECTLEEMKHPASALLFTFPWKQIWWVLEMEDEKHCVELQHGLRGGFRSVLLDGEVLYQSRGVGNVLWDAGSEFSFSFRHHSMKVVIALEGAFFSQYLQYYSYTLLVDEEHIVPLEE